MKKHSILKLASASLVLLPLFGCTESTNFGGFERQYMVSRSALESGKFDQATRKYAQLLSASGRYQPWVQLEYAHALLRANHFNEAATQARSLASSRTGSIRSAALAVQGTAEHELGMADAGPNGMAYLKSAQAALNEVLKNDPELDRLGTIKARKTQLDKQIKNR